MANQNDFTFTFDDNKGKILTISSSGNSILHCSPEEARLRLEKKDGGSVHKPLLELVIKNQELTEKNVDLNFKLNRVKDLVLSMIKEEKENGIKTKNKDGE